jgi:hypothetical protein
MKAQHDVQVKQSEIEFLWKIIYHRWLWDGLQASKKFFSSPPNPHSRGLLAYQWVAQGKVMDYSIQC